MDDVAAIIVDNLKWWSLGFLCGWIVCTVVCRIASKHSPHLHHHGDPMTTRKYSLLAALVTVAVAVAVSVIVYAAEHHTDGASELWNTCRRINYPLGVLVAVGVVYRLVLMAFDRPRWNDPRAVHMMAWFAYIAANLLAAAMTSHHYEVIGADATWVSGFRTTLMCAAVVLTVWWPHPVQFFRPSEGATR